MTPAQIARNRYDEAHQIRDAWEHRLSVAQKAHNEARRTGGDEVTTRRGLKAIEIEHDDAVAAMQLAHHIWVEAAREQAWRKGAE